MHALDDPRKIVKHGPYFGTASQHIERAGGACARQIMIDLAAHRYDLARDGVGERGGGGCRFIGQHSERGFQEMRQIGDMTARAAYHFGAMRDETVELTGERRDLGGKRPLKAASAAFTNASKPFADASKRHQTKMDLVSNGDKQADTERGGPPGQGSLEKRHIRF